ncbi:MAG: hypothetical protein WC859_10320 [Elusimicrobiota bacterium]|jgi:hypothetical protein
MADTTNTDDDGLPQPEPDLVQALADERCAEDQALQEYEARVRRLDALREEALAHEEQDQDKQLENDELVRQRAALTQEQDLIHRQPLGRDPEREKRRLWIFALLQEMDPTEEQQQQAHIATLGL